MLSAHIWSHGVYWLNEGTRTRSKGFTSHSRRSCSNLTSMSRKLKGPKDESRPRSLICTLWLWSKPFKTWIFFQLVGETPRETKLFHPFGSLWFIYVARRTCEVTSALISDPKAHESPESKGRSSRQKKSRCYVSKTLPLLLHPHLHRLLLGNLRLLRPPLAGAFTIHLFPRPLVLTVLTKPGTQKPKHN